MKYKPITSKSRYLGFLSFSPDMVCRCKLIERKTNKGDSNKAHYEVELDEPCEFVVERQGESEKLITAPAGSRIGIREIPPIQDLRSFKPGTHFELVLLGTRMQGESARHDVQISVAEDTAA
jgi:hypothetical protein